MATEKLAENIYYVGVMDWDRRLFDSLIPLPDGTSYNSYVIKGSEKTALVDTVDPPMVQTLLKNIKESGIEKLDYIVSHHGEQDHSGSLPDVLDAYPDSKVIANSKNKTLLMDLLHIPEGRIVVVEDGDTVSLGDRELEFIFLPWVHWPETMATYIKEEKILFPCDFLGSHYATDELVRTGTDKDKEELYDKAKRYYAEIMMPFAKIIRKNLDKIKKLDIDMIAPSHGPIYKGADFIIDYYSKWSSDEVKNEVLIPYVSMHGSTENMVTYLKERLEERGITVKVFDLVKADIGDIAMELVDAATVVLGTPTVLAGPHPNAVFAAYLVKALRPKTKFISIIGSYGWGGKTVETITDMLSSLKAEVIEPVVTKGLPSKEDLNAIEELARQIEQKHKTILK